MKSWCRGYIAIIFYLIVLTLAACTREDKVNSETTGLITTGQAETSQQDIIEETDDEDGWISGWY